MSRTEVVVETLKRLARMPLRQREVLIARYGGKTLEAAGEEWGMTRDEVRVSEGGALRELTRQ